MLYYMIEFLCWRDLEFFRKIIEFKGKIVILCLISRVREDFLLKIKNESWY
jgi:hypothetical protein